MSVQIPKTMRALVQEDKAMKVSVKEIPVPEIADDEVLVKVEYAAQNPTDWKHAAWLSAPGVINGCDYSGTVVKVGSNLKVPLQLGDKVAGWTHGGVYTDRGAFAEYTKVPADLTFKVPESLKMEDAATFGVGWGTANQVLFGTQKHDFPPQQVSGNPWYIIYGASSSVGLFAIQLAKAIGYKVLGVASPHSFDLIKAYGADEAVDYHDAEKAIAEAKRITDGGVEFALDTISEGASFKIAIGMMGDKGKQLNCLLPPPKEAKEINENVKIVDTLGYTMFGKEFNFTAALPHDTIIPANPEDRKLGAAIAAHSNEVITKYKIKANPVVIRGTLDDVTSGFEDMKNGEVSGKKLVYKIAA
ncbi:hypothetical protein CI109_100064 [Kwoniella shandongensis]|uniref:Uncharacterized protein n=1 Tax=Kwoniella shandongensis TaxID=1734106 RepID=A0A5M6BVR2_9TREE|nr:uncharacterized protein CI109_005963 [Kwoniella shandongensis]KAA5525655.1 hypothetical protein CI109_005963 [Kwoniella shandongensis]